MGGIGDNERRAMRLLRASLIIIVGLLTMGFGVCAYAAVLNVTSYGAVANDGIDDLGAIQAAINASSAGDTVFLPTGAFSITGPINARSGITIAGAGRASTTVRYAGGGGNPMVNLGGVSNVEIANLTLHGNGSAAQGINAWSGSGQYIHDTGIQNLGPNAIGIYFSSGVTDSRIVNNQLSDIGVGSEWGAGVRLAWGSSRNQVLDNTIANAGRGGIFGNNGSTDLVIRNNTVSGSGSGGTGLGIEVWVGGDRALIEGNSVDQWLSVDNSSRVAVRHNVVNGGFAGLEFASGGHDNVFTDNTVNGAFIGISVSGPSSVKERVLWAHNTIQASTAWGTQIMSEEVGGAVKQMYFYENTFTGSTQAGFRFHPNYPNGSIENVTLDSNTITANSYGLTAGDWSPGPRLDKLTVVDNTITNNSLAAFSGSMGTPAGDAYFGNDLRWAGNTVTGNGVNNQQTSKGTFFNNLPTASIVAPTSFAPGQPVSFAFNYSGPYSIANILWDLGDGLPQTVSNPVHVYNQRGTYRVNLVVWDALGRAAHDEILLNLLLAGDVNSDGHVDFGDLSLLAPYFRTGAGHTWLHGDFNGNGFVNLADIDLMAANFGLSPTSGPLGITSAELYGALHAMIPEPTTVTMTICVILWHTGRRRRGTTHWEENGRVQ